MDIRTAAKEAAAALKNGESVRVFIGRNVATLYPFGYTNKKYAVRCFGETYGSIAAQNIADDLRRLRNITASHDGRANIRGIVKELTEAEWKRAYNAGGFRERYAMDHSGGYFEKYSPDNNLVVFTYGDHWPYQDANGATWDRARGVWVN